jgi:hypothetical protein
MTAKKITPTNPETLPATEADKSAETASVDRKTAGIHWNGRKTASVKVGRKTSIGHYGG